MLDVPPPSPATTPDPATPSAPAPQPTAEQAPVKSNKSLPPYPPTSPRNRPNPCQRHVDDDLLGELHRALSLVDGRGACSHPDGTVRLARSALTVFAGDLTHHRAGRCNAALFVAQAAEPATTPPRASGT
jgi:hypothetical protein